MAIFAKQSHYHSCKITHQVLGARLVHPRIGKHLSPSLPRLSAVNIEQNRHQQHSVSVKISLKT